MPRTITSIVGKVYILVGINSQSFDTQVGYNSPKYTLDNHTLENYSLAQKSFVAGAWGDCSADLHSLVQKCAESQEEHLCRSTGRPEMKGNLV